MCNRIDHVHAYLDGELSLRDREAFEAHVQTCPECRALLVELRSLSQFIAAAPTAQMPPQLLTRLEKSWWASRDRGVMRVAGWLTTAAATILIGALWLRPHSTDTSTPWQAAAVMPPVESRDEPAPELALAAQWMASDLSVAEGPQ